MNRSAVIRTSSLHCGEEPQCIRPEITGQSPYRNRVDVWHGQGDDRNAQAESVSALDRLVVVCAGAIYVW